MKLKVTIEFDTQSGEYELTFNNVSEPGTGIDRDVLMEGLTRILQDFTKTTRVVAEEGKRMDN